MSANTSVTQKATCTATENAAPMPAATTSQRAAPEIAEAAPTTTPTMGTTIESSSLRSLT